MENYFANEKRKQKKGLQVRSYACVVIRLHIHSSTLSRVWSLYNTIDQISHLDLKYFMNTCPGGQDGGNSLR